MSVLYTFLQVGCADCTVLSLNSKVVMVDCHQDHEYGEFLDDHLRDGQIDVLILTHQHYDHFMGVPKLLDKGIKVHQVWESPYVRKQNDTSVSAEEWRDYQSLVTKLVEKGAARLSPVCSGESVATIGGYEFYILNPAARVNGVDSGTLHDNCLVVMAVREKEKLIFCGDASDSALKRVGDTFDLSNTHILHASSHGALPGAHAGFIRQTNPRYTIISTRSGIREQVPSAEAMKRYLAYTRGKVFQTDIHGTVRFS